MEHLIIDVVIGLLLVYIAASFLLMKIQEGVHGGFYRGRVSNLLKAMDEAVGRDPDLRKQVMDNRLIASLWSGDGDPRAGGLFTRAEGPSKIPGDLFAKALLMSLNPSGKLPSTELRTPLDFMDALIGSTKQGSDREKYLLALRGLVPGPDAGWPEFELAIGTWFCDIGDRAEGWYKRRSEAMGLLLAALLCVAINIDTCHMINVLGSDTELRQGFGALAQLVVQQNGEATGAGLKTATLDPALDPTVRAVARLRDARRRVEKVFTTDTKIGAYGAYESDAREVCAVAQSAEALAAERVAAQKAEAASAALAAVGASSAGSKKSAKKAGSEKSAAGSEPARPVEYVSNSDVWVKVLIRLQAILPSHIQRVGEGSSDEKALRAIHACLGHVGAWVDSGIAATSNPDSRADLQEAVKGIEDSAASVLAVMRTTQIYGGLRNLFRVDPDAFERCARMPQIGLAALSSCVLKEQGLMNRLPVGHGGANWRAQFCRVEELSTKATPKERVEFLTTTPSWPCDFKPMEAQPQLGLEAMRLVPDTAGFFTVLGGYIVSALFISLGGPVLFGFLNKWIGLKNAGRVRDASLSAVQGAGTLPLPMLAVPGVVTTSSGATTKIGSMSTAEGAQPGLEENLSARETQALKQRLSLTPSTGGFDQATRAALLRETGSETLTLASYVQLMGRAPLQSGPQLGALPTARPQRRQPYALAPTLAENLNRKTNFPNRENPSAVTTFTDEMRAMAVLFRFKRQGVTDHQAPIFRVVEDHPEQLDQIEESLLNEILGEAIQPFPRFPDAPWMDIALGELGQVERDVGTRATSNPRICDYLDAVSTSLGDQGDKTPWCAAFVTWVLKHPQAAGSKKPFTSPIVQGFKADLDTGLLLAGQSLESAASWKGWQRPTGSPLAPVVGNKGTPPPAVGDVVVVEVEPGKFHTGFVFELGKTGADEFWMLGGNQRGGTRVSLSRFALTSIRS